MRQDAPGCVDYYPGWVEDADRLFGVLQDQIAWEQHELTLYGRTMPTPRLTAWIGDSAYRSSRSDFASNCVSTSIRVWPISIGTAPTQWATTATMSPNWAGDRRLRPSALEIGGDSCCGIGPPVSDGVGTWARATCWSCVMSRKATMHTLFPRRRDRSGLG